MTSTTSILIIDDDEQLRRTLARALIPAGYDCLEAGDVSEAQRILAEREVQLVLCDIHMPGESGLDFVGRLLRQPNDVAVVMATGVDDAEAARIALDHGAYGYLIKPFTATELKIAVENASRRRSLEIQNREHRERLEDMVRERTADLWTAIQGLERAQADLQLSREETIVRLAAAAEHRDVETGQHLERMSRYAAILAARAGVGPGQGLDTFRLAALLHDIGKIGVPDAVLRKRRALTDEEWVLMRRHADIGHELLADSMSPLLQVASVIAWSHHERFDGTGYPRRLKGAAIPLEGRIAAIADAFDALTSNRVYRPAFPLAKALEMMREDGGTHFDPDLLHVFLSDLDPVLEIWQSYPDRNAS